MEATTLKVEHRQARGTRLARALRRTGRIPGVIYGHGEDPESISLDSHSFGIALAHHQRTLALDLGGETRQYLIKEVQYDHLGIKPIHMDLMRIDLDERVRVTVDVELRGVPKGVHDGGVLDQFINEIEIECLAMAIPEALRPLVTDLAVNESLLVKDLEVPEGIEVLTDPEARVASVRVLAVEADDEVEGEPETEGGGAEPERIGRVRPEDESKETK